MMTNNFFTYFKRLNLNENIIFESCRGEVSTRYELKHSQYDGVSGLVSLLKKVGVLSSSSILSTGISKKQISKTSYLKALVNDFRYLLNDLLPKVSAKYLKTEAHADVKSEHVTFYYFSEGELELLRSSAKAREVTLNSFLLLKANNFVKENFNITTGPQRWMLPVSLYKSISHLSDSGNNSSFIEQVLTDQSTFQGIDQEIHRKLDNKLYLSPKRIERLLMLLPDSVILKVIKSHFDNNKRLGSFSNLGYWSIDTIPDDMSWGFSAPLSYNQPISFSVLTINSKMTIALRIYEDLLEDKVFDFREYLINNSN